jgi:hypothetical protein
MIEEEGATNVLKWRRLWKKNLPRDVVNIFN